LPVPLISVLLLFFIRQNFDSVMKKHTLFLFLLSMVGTYSCKKNAAPALQITSIDPASGANGVLVTISGRGFSANPADDLVFFNGNLAAIASVATGKLVVTAPDSAGTGAITIKVYDPSIAGPVLTAAGPIFSYTVPAVSTLAGSTAGYADGNGTSAQFSQPYDVAADGQGNIYVADYGNNRIRKISPAGIVTTLAGNGTKGYLDGPGSTAEFNDPFGVAADRQGNIYVADWSNQRIRKIAPDGTVSTLAGNGALAYQNGTGTGASFWGPIGITVDVQGNVYVGEFGNDIRKITPAGVVTTLAGSGVAGYADGAGTAAAFNYPARLTVDTLGNVYVADGYNNCIRRINSAGNVTTIAGSLVAGYVDATGTAAEFNAPGGISIDGMGNIYVFDFSNYIRRINSAGGVSTIASNGPTTRFSLPLGFCLDRQGNIYIADMENQRIRKITMQP
jgi:sugar lactone lactonase YvrE